MKPTQLKGPPFDRKWMCFWLWYPTHTHIHTYTHPHTYLMVTQNFEPKNSGSIKLHASWLVNRGTGETPASSAECAPRIASRNCKCAIIIGGLTPQKWPLDDSWLKFAQIKMIKRDYRRLISHWYTQTWFRGYIPVYNTNVVGYHL